MDLPSRPALVKRNAWGNSLSNSADFCSSASISLRFFFLESSLFTSLFISSRACFSSSCVGGWPSIESGQLIQHSGICITRETLLWPGFVLESRYIQYRGCFWDSSSFSTIFDTSDWGPSDWDPND